MRIGEMRHLLRQSGIGLSKALGQNFLHDGNQLRRIVQCAALRESDRVLEIGPGLGPLTELLLPKVQKVLAIEKDRRLIELLKRRFVGMHSLKLFHADALKYLRENAHDWRDWKLVSNLPFSVGAAILVELAMHSKAPSRMIVTMQLEVARRIRATHGQKDYGILSLLLQVIYEARITFRIPANCFFPKPKVTSACVILRRRPCPLLCDKSLACFVKLIKTGFGQRRKRMIKLLRHLCPERHLRNAYEKAGIPIDARAESVSLEAFVSLAQTLEGDLQKGFLQKTS